MKLRMRTILTFTISLLLLQVLFVAGFAITPPHAVTVGVPAQASWVRQSGDPQSISIGAFNVQGPLNGQNAQGAQLHAIDGSQNEGTITFEVSEDGTFTLAAIANGNVISNSATFKATTGSSLSSQVNKVVQPETTLSSTSSSTSQTTSTSSKIIIGYVAY
ncbi:hypothetical protein D9758_010375 [Tetrapyrgos nigripes]|uniref:Uncharacterized protein n=1 Tax=Tetrapyrgos nigripes TaxID=182062 RepID=A0A8H5CZB1_9AGAR|nr:hypothetical protein D9758_010375 [Tetrapyrgos nigripes]